MSSRAQRPMQSLISLRNAFGFKAVSSFNGKSMKEFDAEGAAARRVPKTRECEGCGERKPIEEMATLFWLGCETYQCEQCRGGP